TVRGLLRPPEPLIARVAGEEHLSATKVGLHVVEVWGHFLQNPVRKVEFPAMPLHRRLDLPRLLILVQFVKLAVLRAHSSLPSCCSSGSVASSYSSKNLFYRPVLSTQAFLSQIVLDLLDHLGNELGNGHAGG